MAWSAPDKGSIVARITSGCNWCHSANFGRKTKFANIEPIAAKDINPIKKEMINFFISPVLIIWLQNYAFIFEKSQIN